jgi:uncharacterized membrane protein
VLQWHHLFSLVPGEIWRDIRMQILMDGLFHVAHYLIALAGLWLLWRNRPGVVRGAASNANLGLGLLGAALLGFGVWQVVDVVGFHWVLGIHRIRVGVPNPLTYDIGWLVAFGATALLAGFVVLRRARDDRFGGAGPGGGPAATGLAALVLLAVLGSARRPRLPR